MTDHFKEVINTLKKSQELDVKQLAHYKSLAYELDEKIKDNAILIRLLEAGIDTAKRNHTISDILNNR